MQTFDVVVVGGGMLGLAATYYLSLRGERVLLLQDGELGGGTSAACTGRSQVNEGALDTLNIRIIRDGLARLETLQEELNADFEFRRLGIINLIKEGQEHLWEEWDQRSAVLTDNGIPCELMDVAGLKEFEPHLNTAGLMGASYSLEGLLNPLLFCQAYAGAARRLGAELRPHTPVTGMAFEGRRVVTIEAGGEKWSAGNVVVTCGAWVPVIMRMVGVEVPIQHTHAEAFVTESLPRVLNNTFELADFYETIHGKPKAVSIGVSQHANGTLVVTEAVTRTDNFHQGVSAWGLSQQAADLLRFLPVLKNVKIVRSWGAPTSFTADEQPMVGWMPQFDNLFTASCFMETITSVPLVCDWMAQMVLGQELPVSLTQFDPARFY